MLKLYAPMLPQEKDSIGALDFYTNEDDPDGEPHADEPRPVRVPCRFDDEEDPCSGM